MNDPYDDIIRALTANQPEVNKKISQLTEIIINQARTIARIQRDLYGVHEADCSSADHISRNMTRVFQHQLANEKLRAYISTIPHSPAIGLFDYTAISQYNKLLTPETLANYCPSLKGVQLYIGEKILGRVEQTLEIRLDMSGTDRILFSEAYGIQSSAYLPIQSEVFTTTITIRSVPDNRTKCMKYAIQISALGDVYFDQVFSLPRNKIAAVQYMLLNCKGRDGHTLNRLADKDCSFDIVTPNEYLIHAEMLVAYHEVDLVYAEDLKVVTSSFDRVVIGDRIGANEVKGRALDPLQISGSHATNSQETPNQPESWLVGYSLIEENSNINLQNVGSDFGDRYCDHIKQVLMKKVSATLLTLSVDSILDFDASGQHISLQGPDFAPENGSLGMLSEAIVANTRNITNILQNAIMYTEMRDSLSVQPFHSFQTPSLCPRRVSYSDTWTPGSTPRDSYNAWLCIKDANKIVNFRTNGDKPSFKMLFNVRNDEFKTRPYITRRLYEDENKIVEAQLVLQCDNGERDPPSLVGSTYISPQGGRDPGFVMPYESLRVNGNTYDPSFGGRHELYSFSCQEPNMSVNVGLNDAVYVAEFKCFVLFKNALNRVGLASTGSNRVVLEGYGLGLKSNYHFTAWNSTEYTCSDGKKFFGIFSTADNFVQTKFDGEYRFRVGPYEYTDPVLVGESDIDSTKWSHERKGKFDFQVNRFPACPGIKGTVDVYLKTEEGETGWDAWPYSGYFNFSLMNDLSDQNSSITLCQCPSLNTHYSKLPEEVLTKARKVSRVIDIDVQPSMVMVDTVTMRVCSLELALQIPITKNFLQELISTDQRFNDVEATIASVRSIAEDSLTLGQQNEQRINEIENTVRAMEAQAELDAGIQFFGFAVEMAMPVMGKVLTIMAEQTSKLSSVTARVLGKGLKKSVLADSMICYGAKSRGVEKSLSNIGRAAVETNVLFRSIKKKPPSLPSTTVDLFTEDKNFVLYDPLEFQKFNIFSAQKRIDPGVSSFAGSVLNHSVTMKQDISSSTLTVYHRPLGFLPERISTLVHNLSTAGLSDADLTARERWLRKTVHPTHSYVTISYDYPIVSTGKTRHVITYTGIGDANPGGLKTGDKAAGVGSYTLEYDVVGLSKVDGYRVMELRSHVECGYTDDQCKSIYYTMFKRTIPEHMSLQEAWEEIGAHSRRRTVIDTEIASTPVSLDREWRLRSMLEQKDWDYNLIFKNCQDYAHGLYYYAQGGPVPKWMSTKSQIQSYLDVSDRLDRLSTWTSYEPKTSYVDHGPLTSA
nr:P1 protein [Carrot reovirus 1]